MCVHKALTFKAQVTLDYPLNGPQCCQAGPWASRHLTEFNKQLAESASLMHATVESFESTRVFKYAHICAGHLRRGVTLLGLGTCEQLRPGATGES